jgi:hypothetical protein
LTALHDLGSGASTDDDGTNACRRRMATPLPLAICPSRRGAMGPQVWANTYHYRSTTFLSPSEVGKLDYACNAGTTDDGVKIWYPGPDSLAEGDAMPAAGSDGWASQKHTNDSGAMFVHSAITVAEITDGTSNTYLLGEKWCDSNHYDDSGTASDDQCWDAPGDWDSLRFTGISSDWTAPDFLPLQDASGPNAWGSFGSAHADGFYMAFCDGGVRFVSYSIDAKTHWCLGNRNDGQVVDAKKL